MKTQESSKRATIIWIFAVNLAVITLVWFLHWLPKTGIYNPAMILIGLSHIAGMTAAFLILCELLLMSRLSILNEAFGMEKLARIHRKVGYFAFSFLLAHVVFATIGYELARGTSFIDQFMAFVLTFNDVLKAAVGFVLFVAVTISSIAMARKYFSYEAWFLLHLSAYLAVFLTFFHQLSVGPDFISQPLFADYWYLLYLITAAIIIWYRLLRPIYISQRFGFRITAIQPETHDTYSVMLEGKNLGNFHYQAGQFAVWQVLSHGLWWQLHPFSFSSLPNSDYLRFTVKASGDYTTALKDVKIGTSVIVDGPHGKFTADYAANKKLLFIAGGVGITPLYALICELAPLGRDITLLYACRSHDDIVFEKQFESLKYKYGLKIHYFFSQEAGTGRKFIDAGAITNLVPDANRRDVFLCGPPPMMAAVSQALNEAGVDKQKIHSELFSY